MKKFKSFALVGLALLSILVGGAFLVQKAEAANVYRFGEVDTDRLLKYVFDTVTGHNHDGVNSRAISTLADGAVLQGTAQGTVLYSTYYARIQYYARFATGAAKAMIGSGAPAGAVIIRGGPANKNCGIGGDGTVLYMCGSDGTNWKAIE